MAFALACTSGEAVPTATPPAQTATSPVTQPAPTPDLGPPRVEEERIFEHIRVLAEDIGVRTAGSPAEQEAIDYAGGSFERWGYDVELQSFTASGPLLRETALAIDGPDGRSIPAMAFAGAAATEGSGRLIDAGTGQADEFPADADGAVLLIQRRDVTFVEMARQAEAAGASGVIVANREPGRFLGVLDPASDLPMAGIDQADGEALRALLAEGPVDVRLDIEERVVTAHNIVARPEGGACRTLTGGHYDTVPWAVGANDNASGAAVVLELARVSAAAGLSGNCFALWGAEEEGLLGSAFFVSTLSEAEREDLEAVFNYDVVGSEDPPVLIGSIALIDAAEALDGDLDVRFSVGALPEGAGSDHQSFINAGIPALMVTTPGGAIHTAQDTVENLDDSFVDAVAMLGLALLREPPDGS